MRYQLVLQFQGDSVSDYDALLVLEGWLIEALGNSAEVDGHDVGSGETNIFVITDTPEATFGRVKVVLEKLDLLSDVTAAHRLASGDHYTLVWPEHSSKPFTVA